MNYCESHEKTIIKDREIDELFDNILVNKDLMKREIISIKDLKDMLEKNRFYTFNKILEN